MDVYRAKTAGFCMGVSLALQKLNSALERKGTDCAPARICTLGPIIHNPQVLAEYESRGVVCVKEASQLHPGDVAVIRAHGITREVEEQVKQSGAKIVDATCPKVKKAQLSIGRATAQGATLLLFGEADHPEVRGLVSYACGPAHVFGSAAELASLHLAESGPYVLASQTTQDRQIFQEIVAELRQRINNLVVLSTICDATRERQEEARNIASCVDVMVIIGGRQSGNTRRLADVAALNGIDTFLVERVEELAAENFLQKNRAGLTAGASTPKSLIDAAHLWLQSL
jgi:4-hydroxy-3-methylbut-2-enyl diphosphate reductase